MHGLETIIARNQRANVTRETEFLDELRHNIALLESAPFRSPYETQVLHYSRALLRVAAGESFAHVAEHIGPAFGPVR
jgi:hypothetical protein